MRKGKVYYKDEFAGILTEDTNGVSFAYDKNYLASGNAKPVSLTMPLREEPYTDKVMLPFFYGLIPEGWLLDIAEKNRDRILTFAAECFLVLG